MISHIDHLGKVWYMPKHLILDFNMLWQLDGRGRGHAAASSPPQESAQGTDICLFFPSRRPAQRYSSFGGVRMGRTVQSRNPYRRHGVRTPEAIPVFDDPYAVTLRANLQNSRKHCAVSFGKSCDLAQPDPAPTTVYIRYVIGQQSKLGSSSELVQLGW